MEEHQPLIGNQKVGFFHPTGTFFRWLVLGVISFICFGSYFTYDEIQNFQDELNTDLGINPADFGLLYSVYSFPNTILVFFGGILGDKIGLRLAGLVFVSLVVAGSVVVAIAPLLAHLIGNYHAFIVMAAGRTLFGCGAESLNVIQTSMTSRWFAGSSSLAFAMGIVLSSSRLGDFLAIFLAPNLATWFGSYRVVLWIGSILCGISLLCVVLYGIMDKATEKYFPERAVNVEENSVNFKAVLHFDGRFWLIAIVCMCYYGGIFPFVSIASGFLSDPNEYDLSSTRAGHYASVVTLSSMVLSPFLGKFLDLVANRPVWVMLGSLAVIPAHVTLALKLAHPLIPIIFMGLSFSLVPSALWPSIPIIIDGKETATAFGVMAAIQNTGLAIIFFVNGKIVSSHYGYTYAMWFFVLLDSIGLLFAIILFLVDKKKGSQLCMTATQRAALESSTPGNIQS